jgi:hypothetical protein
MPYLLAIFLVLIFGVFLGFSSARSETRESKEKPKVEESETTSADRSEIRERLKTLFKSNAPKELSKGAMCYRMAMPPTIVEYVCPKCGEKTLYTGEEGPRSVDDTNKVRREIVACRRVLKEIEGLDIELDENQFCAKCTPDLKEVPKICLLVRYEGEKESHRVEGITSEDLIILKEFLDGKDKHTGRQGVETPLRNYVDRLEELLGVEVEVLGKKE